MIMYKTHLGLEGRKERSFFLAASVSQLDEPENRKKGAFFGGHV